MYIIQSKYCILIILVKSCFSNALKSDEIQILHSENTIENCYDVTLRDYYIIYFFVILLYIFYAYYIRWVIQNEKVVKIERD